MRLLGSALLFSVLLQTMVRPDDVTTGALAAKAAVVDDVLGKELLQGFPYQKKTKDSCSKGFFLSTQICKMSLFVVFLDGSTASTLHPPLLCSSFSLHRQRSGRRPLPYTTSQQQISMATRFLWRNIGNSLLQTFSLCVWGCIFCSNSSPNVSCACRGNVVIITNVASK